MRCFTVLAAAAIAISGLGLSPARAEAAFTAHVTITVRLSPSSTPVKSTLTCAGASSRACRALADNPRALWPNSKRQCTQIYGGPERARIRGTVNGRAVNVVVTRTDGCGMSDWAALTPVIGPPGA
ncbi:MAG: hypothetical protein ACKOFP_01340 [Actinomycetota bacterium]